MKKVLSFLSVLVLTILVSVFSVACGDKYKNMYLEVQYLEWTRTDENGVEHGKWKKIDVNPKSENYGLSFMLKDVYKNETNDCYELRMRVLVKGTKKKVDQIYVLQTLCAYDIGCTFANSYLLLLKYNNSASYLVQRNESPQRYGRSDLYPNEN